MNLISEYFRDDGASAEVVALDNCYAIVYYNNDDMLIEIEYYKENSIHYVEDAAENWALRIKKTPEVIC